MVNIDVEYFIYGFIIIKKIEKMNAAFTKLLNLKVNKDS